MAHEDFSQLLREFRALTGAERRNGDTLEAILNLVKENLPPERPYLFQYPDDGTYDWITTGWTTVDFQAGTVTTPAGAVTRIQKALPAHSHGVCRSLMFDCDSEAIVQLDNNDKFPVYSGLVLKDVEFRVVRIYVPQTANMFIAASTSPDTFTDPYGYGDSSMAKVMVYGKVLDADGSLNYFETDQAITDIATLYMTLFPTNIKKFKLTSVKFYMDPTNAVTYELYLLSNTVADDITNLSYVVFDSDAAKADSVAYVYTGSNSIKVPTDVLLEVPGRLYYMIDWSGAPGDTKGYLDVRGEAMI